MTFKNDAELVTRVAAAAVKATLAATAAGRPTPLKMPTPPKVPTRPNLTPARPARPTPLTRPTRTAAAAPAPAPVDRERLAVAFHEAGHAVAGVVLGAEVQTAVVPFKGLLAGQFKGQTFFYRGDPEHYRPMVSYAGPWAQAKFAAGNQRPTQRQFYDVMNSHGCHDARVLTAAGGLHEGAGVQPILERCWPAVKTLAHRLYQLGVVNNDDVLAALGVTDGGGLYSAQVSGLRHGSRSVPAFKATPAPA